MSLLEPSGGKLNSQLSFSKDGLITTSYLDDSIVQGKVFNITLAQAFTAGVPINFTSEYLSDKPNALFLLPISINPTAGFLILNIYEDTEYSGGSEITALNRNRVSGEQVKITVKLGATGTVKGTIIQTWVYGVSASGTPAGPQGGGSGVLSNSLILDQNKRYLYELTNSETATVGIDAEFVEL